MVFVKERYGEVDAYTCCDMSLHEAMRKAYIDSTDVTPTQVWRIVSIVDADNEKAYDREVMEAYWEKCFVPTQDVRQDEIDALNDKIKSLEEAEKKRNDNDNIRSSIFGILMHSHIVSFEKYNDFDDIATEDGCKKSKLNGHFTLTINGIKRKDK